MQEVWVSCDLGVCCLHDIFLYFSVFFYTPKKKKRCKHLCNPSLGLSVSLSPSLSASLPLSLSLYLSLSLSRSLSQSLSVSLSFSLSFSFSLPLHVVICYYYIISTNKHTLYTKRSITWSVKAPLPLAATAAGGIAQLCSTVDLHWRKFFRTGVTTCSWVDLIQSIARVIVRVGTICPTFLVDTWFKSVNAKKVWQTLRICGQRRRIFYVILQ